MAADLDRIGQCQLADFTSSAPSHIWYCANECSNHRLQNHRYAAPTDLAVANPRIAGLGVALFTVRLAHLAHLASAHFVTSPMPTITPIDLKPL